MYAHSYKELKAVSSQGRTPQMATNKTSSIKTGQSKKQPADSENMIPEDLVNDQKIVLLNLVHILNNDKLFLSKA